MVGCERRMSFHLFGDFVFFSGAAIVIVLYQNLSICIIIIGSFSFNYTTENKI